MASRAPKSLEDIDTMPQPNEPTEVRSQGALLACLALLTTVAAWVVLLLPPAWAGYVSLALAVAGIATGVGGLRSPKRGWRDISTTSIIASGVLVIIIIAFLIVIYWVL